jgi:hypothetical protein
MITTARREKSAEKSIKHREKRRSLRFFSLAALIIKGGSGKKTGRENPARTPRSPNHVEVGHHVPFGVPHEPRPRALRHGRVVAVSVDIVAAVAASAAAAAAATARGVYVEKDGHF